MMLSHFINKISKINIVQTKSANMSIETVLLLIIVGLAAGVLSGMVGVGGGIIVVPALVIFLGFSQHQAQGTSLGLLLLPVGILAVMNYYNKGYIDIKVVAIMSIAFVLGGWLGSKLSLSLPQDTVKKIFAIVLFYTAFRMMGWDSVIAKWIKGVFQ
jgi:uncharacterized membrane protein YfcA